MSCKGITHARNNRVEARESIQKGDEVGHVKVSYQRKVSAILQEILVILGFWSGQRLLVGIQ